MELNSIGIKRRGVAAACLCAGGYLSAASAAPFTDVFQDLTHISNVASTCALTAGSSGLQATFKNPYGNGIFKWSQGATWDYNSAFSLDAADQQNLFQVTGVNKITAAGASTYTYLRVYFSFLTPDGIGNTNSSYIYISHGENVSSWSVDVSTLVSGMPADTRWIPVFYINGDKNPSGNVGFSISSFAAVPEPATVASLAVCGLAGLWLRRRGNRS